MKKITKQILIIILLCSSITFAIVAHVDRLNAQYRLIELTAERDSYLTQNRGLWQSIEVLQAEVKEKTELLAAWQEPVNYRDVCSISIFKSWMDYLKIADHSSLQWKLQQVATTESNFGFRWIDHKYIMIAMSAQYGPVGTKYLITFESGQSMYAIIGDIKQDYCMSIDSSIIEFIVDINVLPTSTKRSGNFNSVFQGSITSIMAIE